MLAGASLSRYKCEARLGTLGTLILILRYESSALSLFFASLLNYAFGMSHMLALHAEVGCGSQDMYNIIYIPEAYTPSLLFSFSLLIRSQS